MKLIKQVRTFSNKKAALGIVTTVIGISSIILASGQAHASTVSTQTHTVTKTPKTSTSTNKTTLKNVNTTTVKAKSIKPTTTTKSTAKAKAVTTKAPTTSKVVPAKSTTTVKKPSATPKKPSTSVKKPSTTPTKPTTSVKKPSTTPTNPTTSVKKPITTPTKPTTSVKKPSTTPTKPTTSVKKPSTTPTKPTTSVKKPSTTTKNPTTSVKKPSTTPAKPTTSVKEPSTTPTKPTTSVKEPSTETKKPTAPIEPTKPSEVQTATEPSKSDNTHTQQPAAVPAITNLALDMPVETSKPDYYKSMTDLYNDTKEGIDWKKDTRDSGSRVLIVAPHGGNIEQGTTELTKLVADDGNYDYFSFEAIRPSNNTQLHVTSTHYDDATLHEMIEDRTATISIHGAQGDEPSVYLGGAKSPLRDAIQSQLENKGFVVKVPPEYLGGANSNNFINKVDGSTGVQLELTTALRKAFFKDGNSSTAARKNIDNWTTTMYDFATALNDAIKNVYPV
ncbi:poly-gamma-glutamate hydrolase family protein [Staphylococcus caeli]|uniref:poly-gamma-glutamate hydrolase family protein n=1 Tax=Staphylococcus caeli TaxID=2201815 RepID=UPI003F543560